MAVSDTPEAPTARASNPQIDDARLLMRGASRLLLDLGISAIPEFTLPCGRRADLAGLTGDDFRAAYLTGIGGRVSGLNFEARVETALDALADHLAAHLDLAAIGAMSGIDG